MNFKILYLCYHQFNNNKKKSSGKAKPDCHKISATSSMQRPDLLYNWAVLGTAGMHHRMSSIKK